MNRRIILRIVLALVILLALALCVVKVIIPLFDTSDEDIPYVPDIQRFGGTDETFTLQNEYLTFTLDTDTTHFTLTTASGKVWTSNATGADLDKADLTKPVEKERLSSILTLTSRDKKGTDTLMTSNQNSVVNLLYTLEKLDENSIRVNYTIGEIPPVYLYPSVILVEDFDELLASKPDLTSSQKKSITKLYKKIDPSAKNYSKTKNLADLEAKYPVLKEGKAIYVLFTAKADTKNKDQLKKNVELFSLLDYTMEMLERDDALMSDYVSVDYSKSKVFNISVVYRLEGNDLVVEVPMDRITFNPSYRLATLSLLPAFGASGLKDEGFILVPEGSGALINFNNGKVKQSHYTASLYGHDYADIRKFVINETRASFPVFGMSKTGNGSFLCILEDGKSWATITANTSGQPNYGAYNAANAIYTIMHNDEINVAERSNEKAFIFEKELPEGSIVQRYRFLDTEGYMDMAAAYRDYLLADPDNAHLQLAEDGQAHTVIEMVGAIDKVQQVFGIPTSVPVTLTTYEEAAALTEKLIAENLPHLSIRYTGWMNGGLNQSVLTSVRLMSEMGSKKELNAFTALASEAGIDLYLDGLTCFARDSGLTEGFIALRDAARYTTREEAEIPEYSPIWYGDPDWRDTYFLLKPEKILESIDVLSEAAAEYGAAGVSFRDVGFLLSADYNPKAVVTRETAREQQEEKLVALAQAGQKVMTRSGNDYAALLSDIVTDMDLDGTAYHVIDQFVPFYTAALHGYVPYTGVSINLADDRQTLLLRSAEMGAGLQYTLIASNIFELRDSWFTEYYGADESQIYDEMMESINLYNTCMDGTFNQLMTGHKREGNVAVTEYENGTRVYVNYGYSDATVDGVTVNDRSFKTINAAGEEFVFETIPTEDTKDNADEKEAIAE